MGSDLHNKSFPASLLSLESRPLLKNHSVSVNQLADVPSDVLPLESYDCPVTSRSEDALTIIGLQEENARLAEENQRLTNELNKLWSKTHFVVERKRRKNSSGHPKPETSHASRPGPEDPLTSEVEPGASPAPEMDREAGAQNALGADPVASTSETGVVNSAEKSVGKKLKVHVVGDSNARDFAQHLREMLPRETHEVSGTCLPNGKLTLVSQTAQLHAQNLSSNDFLVVFGGLNDVLNSSSVNSDLSWENLSNLTNRCNVIVSEIRNVFCKSSYERNISIFRQNQLLTANPALSVLKASDLGKEFSARDSIHTNIRGKRILASRAKAIILQKNRREIPFTPEHSASHQVMGAPIPVILNVYSSPLPPKISFAHNFLGQRFARKRTYR